MILHELTTVVPDTKNSGYMMGVPFNRQEKDWYRLGLVLPRSNMANWTIRCSEEWLKPVYDRIHQIQMECRYLHMDETRIQRSTRCLTQETALLSKLYTFKVYHK